MHSRINRNILECKVKNHHLFLDQDPVLIETYWNVKVAMQLLPQFCLRINRNILECKVLYKACITPVASGINRNILECKVGCICKIYAVINVLIETYWNVKVLSAGGSATIFRGGKNIPAFRSSDIFYRRRSAVWCSDFDGSGYYVNLCADPGGSRQ